MHNGHVIETPFICERDGLQIRGMQYLPNGVQQAHYPAIIVGHGFTGNYLDTADYCRAFAGMGYAAFGFNFCGGGSTDDDPDFRSDGQSTDSTILTEVEDLIAVKNAVQALPFVDESNLILAGFSQGGLVSGLTAAKCKDEIKKLIMIYPALCIPDHARRGCLAGADYDVNDVPAIIDCKRTQLGRIYHDTVVDMDVFLELSPYQGPVLILHGLEDEVVDYSYAIRARESYAPGQCHLQLIRDVGHSFSSHQQESAIASMREFLLERKELLTIRVILTNHETMQDGDYRTTRIYFTGYCDNALFRGTIMPEGCDTQEHYLDELTKMRAEYTLLGLDQEGQRCRLHIVNQRLDGGFKPTIETDSKHLAWLSQADLTAVLEFNKDGPTVRIFG